MQTKTKKICAAGLKWILLLLLTFLFLMPVIWVICSSFKSVGELFSWPPSLLGKNPSLDNYTKAMAEGHFGVYFFNTVFVSLVATFLTIVVNVMSGYAFAKYHFKGDKILFGIVLATLMVPLEVIMIPIFKVIVATHLYNNLWGLIIPAVASPTAVFLVRQYYVGIPDAYMEAARIDGLSHAGVFARIVCPISKPLFASIAILNFTGTWNSYMVPATFINKVDKYTLVVGLQTVNMTYFQKTNLTLAGVVLLSFPVILFFICTQKEFVKGAMSSGIKA